MARCNLALELCAASASWINWLMSSVHDTPLAVHSFGYMLMGVKPGMVLISFNITCDVIL